MADALYGRQPNGEQLGNIQNLMMFAQCNPGGQDSQILTGDLDFSFLPSILQFKKWRFQPSKTCLRYPKNDQYPHHKKNQPRHTLKGNSAFSKQKFAYQ